MRTTDEYISLLVTLFGEPRTGRRAGPAAGCDPTTMAILTRTASSGTSLGIRYAVPVDLVSVEAVVQAAYRHYIDRIGVRPRPMDVDYAELMRRGCLFVVGSPAVATVTLQRV